MKIKETNKKLNKLNKEIIKLISRKPTEEEIRQNLLVE